MRSHSESMGDSPLGGASDTKDINSSKGKLKTGKHKRIGPSDVAALRPVQSYAHSSGQGHNVLRLHHVGRRHQNARAVGCEVNRHPVQVLHLLAEVVERLGRNLVAILVHMPSDDVWRAH